MKKKFLTMMLFFAFLFAGIQNVSAQDGLVVNANYVSTTEATTILAAEISSIEENPIYSQEQENHPQYPELVRKINFYVAVSEGIVIGNTIPTAIMEGAEEANDIQDETGETFEPYLQEIVALLSE